MLFAKKWLRSKQKIRQQISTPEYIIKKKERIALIIQISKIYPLIDGKYLSYIKISQYKQ